jgi:predicted metal-binding membrane protein
VIAYLAVWLAVGAAVILSAQWWSGLAGTALSAGALLGAAAWQLTPQKRAALAACHRPRPLPPRGLTAEAGSVRFGLMNGYACLRSCWAMMIPMAIAGSASIAWMIALSAIVMTEKRALRPRHTTRVIAGVLACSATLVAVLGGSTL